MKNYRKYILCFVMVCLLGQINFLCSNYFNQLYQHKNERLSNQIQSQIVLSNNQKLEKYQISYPYFEYKMEVGLDDITKEVQVISYYPEQFDYDVNKIYLSAPFSLLSSLSKITIANKQYSQFEVIDKELYPTNKLVIFVPYENLSSTDYTSYFVDLDQFDTSILNNLMVENDLSSFYRNYQQLQKDKKQIQMIKMSILIFLNVLMFFLNIQSIQSVLKMDVLLRMISDRYGYVFIYKWFVVSSIYLIIALLFRNIQIGDYIYLVGIHLGLDFILDGRKSMVQWLRN